MHKKIQRIIRDAEAAGHRLGPYTKHGVWLLHSDGESRVLLPGSPGGGRWEQNMQAELRRKGFLPV